MADPVYRRGLMNRGQDRLADWTTEKIADPWMALLSDLSARPTAAAA